ncbi:MAG TPA: glycosyltransferase family 39 protein [Planctomycetaceae bacterium]|nr:glycosyltransferase family 39 protein [Planctomycetaceae bacterium]
MDAAGPTCSAYAPALTGVALDDASRRNAVWAFTALGIFLRLSRFLACFPLWGDESYLAINFCDRDLEQLAGILDFGQVCPVGFLWIEGLLVRSLGYSEWTMRVFPCACAIASVLLFRHVAQRLLTGWPQVLAVALFAVSYYPIRHGAEVKPYAVDALMALGLLALAIEWLKTGHDRWLWSLALVGPLAMTVSYPAVFVAGGVSVVLLPSLWKDRRLAAWIPFALYNLAFAGVFLVLVKLVADNQFSNSVDAAGVKDFWKGSFPPIARPWNLPVWFLQVHTGRMFGYPFGDNSGTSTPAFACFAMGAWALWRRHDRTALALCLAPFAFTFIAAAAERYPYGGNGRVAQHLAPAICLLGGLGAAAFASRARNARRASTAVAYGLAIFGCGLFAVDLIRPFKCKYDQEFRNLARLIWTAPDAKTVCVARDLREPFALRALEDCKAPRGQYACYQRMFQSSDLWRLGSHTPGAVLDFLTPGETLRCVVFRLPEQQLDRDEVSAWLKWMQERFDWIGYEKHDLISPYRVPTAPVRFEVYEFAFKAAPDVVPSDWRARYVTAQGGPPRPK